LSISVSQKDEIIATDKQKISTLSAEVESLRSEVKKLKEERDVSLVAAAGVTAGAAVLEHTKTTLEAEITKWKETASLSETSLKKSQSESAAAIERARVAEEQAATTRIKITSITRELEVEKSARSSFEAERKTLRATIDELKFSITTSETKIGQLKQELGSLFEATSKEQVAKAQLTKSNEEFAVWIASLQEKISQATSRISELETIRNELTGKLDVALGESFGNSGQVVHHDHTCLHGYHSEAANDEDTFYLSEGEIIVRVEGRAATRVEALQFFTNFGRASKVFGGSGGLPFSWTADELEYFTGGTCDQIGEAQYFSQDIVADHSEHTFVSHSEHTVVDDGRDVVGEYTHTTREIVVG